MARDSDIADDLIPGVALNGPSPIIRIMVKKPMEKSRRWPLGVQLKGAFGSEIEDILKDALTGFAS